MIFEKCSYKNFVSIIVASNRRGYPFGYSRHRFGRFFASQRSFPSLLLVGDTPNPGQKSLRYFLRTRLSAWPSSSVPHMKLFASKLDEAFLCELLSITNILIFVLPSCHPVLPPAE